jgi:hypothetical protein
MMVDNSLLTLFMALQIDIGDVKLTSRFQVGKLRDRMGDRESNA